MRELQPAVVRVAVDLMPAGDSQDHSDGIWNNWFSEGFVAESVLFETIQSLAGQTTQYDR
jgi:hypothetical protein